jgi:hypothetical protein
VPFVREPHKGAGGNLTRGLAEFFSLQKKAKDCSFVFCKKTNIDEILANLSS